MDGEKKWVLGEGNVGLDFAGRVDNVFTDRSSCNH